MISLLAVDYGHTIKTQKKKIGKGQKSLDHPKVAEGKALQLI
jgi:hypothetical protein